ncbi:MAG: tRNA (adenosine(37)-N6)-threonylcarbamoyltransferase complex ATPase subunit type 1 TsaE [bacterium]
MESCKIVFLTQTEDETRRIGAALGGWLRPGDLVALAGDLGSGKTCLTQGIAQGLGVPDAAYVRSPSFVLMHTYPGRFPVYHLDLYRIRDASELEDLGVREIFGAEGVCVIEWADKISEWLPEAYVRVSLAHESESRRRIEIEAVGESYASRWESLEKKLTGATHRQAAGERHRRQEKE